MAQTPGRCLEPATSMQVKERYNVIKVINCVEITVLLVGKFCSISGFSFGNPGLISLPTSRRRCTEVLDLHLA